MKQYYLTYTYPDGAKHTLPFTDINNLIETSNKILLECHNSPSIILTIKITMK